MIKSDFYADYQTVVDDMIITNSITTLNITDIDTDPNRAYYMGQIPGNIAPDILPSKFVVTESENPMESVVSFEKQNTAVNWGYCYSGSSGHTMTWNGTQYLAGFSLFNSLSAYKLTNRSGISIYFKFFRFTNVTLDSGTVVGTCGSGDNANYTHNFDNTANFISWVTGGTTIQLTVFGSTVDLHYADLDTRGEYSPSENVFVIFCGYSAESRSYYGNSTVRYIYPFYSYRVNDRYFANTAFPNNRYKNTRIAFKSDLSEFICDTINSTLVYFGDNYGFTGEREITVTGEFLDYVRRTGYTMNFYRLNSTGAIVSYSGYYTASGVTYYQCGTIGAMDPGTLWTLYCLINKICNTGYDYTVQYTTNHTIALFTANNTPVPGRVQFTTYPETAEKLRDWQKYGYNITDDNFDPGNPPEPEPRPEPVDPGNEETGGDDYEPNNPAGLGSGFGFVTQYAIRAAHLTDLGSKLWEGFFSEDEPGGIFQYMNNFIFAVNTDTGSVNFSDIMQFFISLRAYPCPISAMASTSAGGQDLYVGSGSKPIHLNTTFSIVNDMIGNINAGELSVPYWFGDYRDYSLECIVYLPYCGTIQLNPGDIMGGTLSVNYTVDFCSGACVAYVLCTTWEGKLLRVGSLQGQLGADVPMTATNAGQVAARMYGDRIDAAETFTGALKSVISGGTSIAGGNYGGAVSAGFGAFIDPALQQERLRANMGSRGAIAAPMLSAGRGLSGFADSKTVFLQIRSPIYAEPNNYDDVVGMPSTSAVRIGDCSGFCQFINVDVSGITTDLDDQQTIRRALESGIII